MENYQSIQILNKREKDKSLKSMDSIFLWKVIVQFNLLDFKMRLANKFFGTLALTYQGIALKLSLEHGFVMDLLLKMAFSMTLFLDQPILTSQITSNSPNKSKNILSKSINLSVFTYQSNKLCKCFLTTLSKDI